jgi:hypothetical protein
LGAKSSRSDPANKQAQLAGKSNYRNNQRRGCAVSTQEAAAQKELQNKKS